MDLKQYTKIHEDLGFALAIETSGAVGSVALGRGDRVLGGRSFMAAQRHAMELLPSIDALCKEHGAAPTAIGRVFVSIGPGSFTGLRIGVAAAPMLAFASGALLVGVPSLEVTAQNALAADPVPSSVVVLIDAKRSRVYAASFDRTAHGFEARDSAQEVVPADFLAVQPQGCAVLGEGIAVHRAVVELCGLRILSDEYHRPRAEVVYRLGAMRASRDEFTPPRMLVPLYIRLPEPEEKLARKLQRGDAI